MKDSICTPKRVWVRVIESPPIFKAGYLKHTYFDGSFECQLDGELASHRFPPDDLEFFEGGNEN